MGEDKRQPDINIKKLLGYAGLGVAGGLLGATGFAVRNVQKSGLLETEEGLATALRDSGFRKALKERFNENFDPKFNIGLSTAVNVGTSLGQDMVSKKTAAATTIYTVLEKLAKRSSDGLDLVTAELAKRRSDKFNLSNEMKSRLEGW